jgi:hypothetical protein
MGVAGASGSAVRKFAVPTAAIAAAAVVAVIGAFVYLRYFSKPPLTDRDVIVLSEFVNTTGDPVFDGTLKQALAAQLDQSPYLNVFPDQRVRDTLRYMGHSPDDRLASALARQVCQHEGLKGMMEGSIAALGSQYTISLNATNCRTGESLARAQVEADGKEKVLAALGKAVTQMRGKLGESLASIQKFELLRWGRQSAIRARSASRYHFSNARLSSIRTLRRRMQGWE